MAQQIIQGRGTALSRLGAGLGQGLAEQLPKEIARERLSSGIKNLKNNPQMDPIDRLDTLYRSGATPEQINQIEPYIRNAALIANQNKNKPNQSSVQTNQNSQPQNANQVNAPQNQQNRSGVNNAPTPSITTPQGEEAVRTPIIQPSWEEIDTKARELMAQDPTLYQGENGYNTAVNNAKYTLEEPLRRQQAEQTANIGQRAQETDVRNRLLDKTTKKLQKDSKGLFEVIPSQLYQRAEKRADLAVANGKTLEQATEDQSDFLKEAGEKIVTLRNNIGGRQFFSKASDQLKKDLNQLIPFFKKNGEQEILREEAKNALDIGDHLSSYEIYKPSQKAEKAVINSSVNDAPRKVAAKLVNSIGDDDSLWSIGYLLNKTGIDDQAVMNEIKDLASQDLIKLNPRQQREAAEYYALNPKQSFGDIMYEAFLGGPIVNYLTGQKQKVGAIERLKRDFGKE